MSTALDPQFQQQLYLLYNDIEAKVIVKGNFTHSFYNYQTSKTRLFSQPPIVCIMCRTFGKY